MAKIVLSGSEEKPMNTHGSPLAKSKRRGSVIRREALERFRKGKGGPLPGGEINNGSPRGVTSDAATGGGNIAWGEEKPTAELRQQQKQEQQKPLPTPSPSPPPPPPPPPQQRSRRRSSLNSVKNISELATSAEGRTADEVSRNEDSTEGVRRRYEAARERRTSRRRGSSLRINDLERLSVEKVGKAFQEMYVPPLGPLDDPAGVIYLDGKLADKAVDIRVLDSIGEGVQEARKELFDLAGRRRSLVEEIRAQNRRVSLGFPRNVVQEEILDKRAQETYTKSVSVESKLKRLLDHRRRLFDVLKASHGSNDGDLSLASKLIRSEPPQARMENVGGGANHIRARRSSLDDLKDLAKELMTREPVATQRDVSTVDRSRRRSVQTAISVQQARARQANKRALNQGWREVIEAVFSEEADMRRQMVRFREGSGGADREKKESSIRAFLVSTTPKEHIEYTVEAMDPARAQDLSSVIKCLLLHYTGPAAGELDILLGGRIGGMEVQNLLEMTLQAVDVVHVEQVPSILLLQWLLGRAPHLRSLLLRGGAIRRAFLRLERAEAKGFGAGERAMQYAALFLFMGLLFS